MAIKLSEIERKLCGLYDITYKIYNSVNDSTAIGDDLVQKFCNDGHINAIDQPNQNNERPLSEYYELTTDLEEVKMNAVINHTKLSNNISSNSKVISENTQEINQLKEQFTNMQSERQTFIKEISKQSEIIKQLSSKVVIEKHTSNP
jgi:chromosome segregation ATPase